MEIILPWKTIGYLMKIPVTRVGYFPVNFWSKDPRVPKATQTVDISLTCPPELDGKVLLLNLPHTLVVWHKGIKLELKACSLLVCFNRDQRFCVDHWERKDIIVFTQWKNLAFYKYWPTRQGVTTATIPFSDLIWLEVWFTGGNPWLAL